MTLQKAKYLDRYPDKPPTVTNKTQSQCFPAIPVSKNLVNVKFYLEPKNDPQNSDMNRKKGHVPSFLEHGGLDEP